MQGPSEQKILLVDASPRMAAAIARAVTGAGYQCRTVDSADAARRALSEQKPDLVLIDDAPEGPDPRQLCQSIRHDRSTARVKIVVLNGSGRRIEQRRCRAFGADGMLAKPFGLEELRAEMRRVLSDDALPVA